MRFTDRTIIRAVGLPATVAVVALLWLLTHAGDLGISPLETRIDYEYPVYATVDDSDRLYVVDTSRRRITRRTPDGDIDLELHGGNRDPGAFFYAEEITVDDGGDLYVLNVVTDRQGYYVEREEILRFDADGRMRAVIHRREYDDPADRRPTLVQRGRIRGLYTHGDGVGWFTADATGITPWRSVDGEASPGIHHDWPDAARHLADIAPYDGSGGGYVYADKNGRITHISRTGEAQLRYRAPQDRRDIVPWDVESYADGRIAFVDLEHRAIRSLPDAAGRPGILLDASVIEASGHPSGSFNYYRLDAPQAQRLVTTNAEAAVVLDTASGSVDYVTGGTRAADRVAVIGLTWLAVAAALIGTALVVYRLYVDGFNRRLPPVLIKSLAIVAVVGLSATIVASIIIPRLTERSETILLEKIATMQATIPETVDGALFDRIDGLGDYDGPAYRSIRDQFLEALNYNRDPWNEGFYFALYRVLDERLYGFMFLNGAIGIYHPYDWLGDGGVYDQALAGGVAMESVTDISGDWMYGVSPVRDDQGNVVALFETGTDLYALNLSTRMLIEEIVYQVITMLIILIILMIELAVFTDAQRRRRAALPATPSRGTFPGGDASVTPADDYSDAMLARIPAFLLFAAVMLSLSYLPLLAREFHTPIAGLSQAVVIALPLSAEMFLFGIGTVVAGAVGSRMGWRVVLLTGLTGVIAGLCASGLATGISTLIGARAIVGLGTGMAFIGLRLLINREGGREARSEGFRHLYAGMSAGTIAGVVLGGTLAGYIGYQSTFFLGVALIMAAVGFYALHLKTTPVMRPRAAMGSDQPTRPGDIIRFFTNRQIWAFLLLLLIPTYIAGTFVAYHFPLFAESRGLDADDIGRWIVVNGLFIIYLGPPLARFLQQTLGATRAAAVGSLVWGTALVVFALTGSLAGAIVTLMIMGIAEGFCAPAQNDAYLELDACQHVGEDRAVGYFELFGKLGETIGPIAFAGALLLGSTGGPLVLGIGIMILALPYLLLRTDRRRKTAGVSPA